MSVNPFSDPTHYFHRYLYEISDYKACLKMAKVASSAYNDKETLLYANISCVTGLVFYDLNNLVESRKSLETTLHLCETLLPLDDIQTVSSHCAIEDPISSHDKLRPQYSIILDT